MGSLDINIDNLKFPVGDDIAQMTSGKSIFGILSAFKSKSKPDVPKYPRVPKEYSYNDYNIFLILRDFLQPSSSITLIHTVNTILEIVGDRYTNSRSYIHVCLELAEQIPYHHPSQAKLAQVLYMIGRSGKRIKFSGLQDAERASIVVNTFYQNLNEELTDNRGDPGDDDVDPMRYVNYQAFLANLLDAGIWRPESSFAIAAMRGAFEDDREKQDPAIREALVMGAAQ